jgi:hypothetical protein
MGAPKGNRNSAKDLRLFTNALRRHYVQNPNKLQSLVLKLDELAQGGDRMAINDVMDRIDGKPPQSIEMSGSLDTSKTADDLTDDQLAAIATGSSNSIATEAEGTPTLN